MEGIMHPWTIFVSGLKNWRVNWLKLAGVYLLIYIPLTIFDSFWMLRGAKPGLVQFAGSLIHWLLDAFVMVSLILSVKEQLSSVISKAMDTMKSALKYLWRYILTTLLYSVITVGIVLLTVIIISFVSAIFTKIPHITVAAILIATVLIIACVAAAVYAVIRFSLAGVVCIMEETGPVAALKISHNLIKKSVSPVVGVFCCIILLHALLLLPAFFLSLLSLPNGSGGISLAIYQVLAGAVAVPIWVSVMVVLYKRLKEVVN
jgi:hypothetical protein